MQLERIRSFILNILIVLSIVILIELYIIIFNIQTCNSICDCKSFLLIKLKLKIENENGEH